jgi:hypothetical protein
MSTITRYYGTVDATTNILVSIDTTPIPADESFTIDVFYGGRATDNPTPESTWIYRYILTYDNFDDITLRNTYNMFGYARNGPFPLTSSVNENNIELIVNTSIAPAYNANQIITTYDCYLNYN